MNTTTQEMLDTVIDASSLVSAVSTFSESSFEDEEMGPPSFILVPASPLERKEAFFASSSNPYAQLCYDPQQSTLVAIMETRRKGRRDVLPDSFPSLQPTKTDVTCSSSNSSCTSQLSNASTFTLSTMTDQRAASKQDKKILPFVLGTQQVKDENSMYLLADDDDKHYGRKRRGGAPNCARALRGLVIKSRPLRFLQVHHPYNKNPPSRSLSERIMKQRYEPIQSQKSLAKWN